MQNRYAADIGDYVKLGLLRHLSKGRKLGVSWYLHPDEDHNLDGRHVKYLSEPHRWRQLDPPLFDALSGVADGVRSIEAIQRSGVLDAVFFADPIATASLPAHLRPEWRQSWYQRQLAALGACDMIFADPDNGLVDDDPGRPTQKNHGKRISLAEATTLARNRVGIIYHHNTRFRGGHDVEVEHWCERIGPETIAVRATAYSCRTFFIMNPDSPTVERARSFCASWSRHGARLHSPSMLA